MDYFIIKSNKEYSFVWREYDDLDDAEKALLGLFNFLYVRNFATWNDVLKSDLSRKIYVWDNSSIVLCFEYDEYEYDIVWKNVLKIKGSSLPHHF